MPLSPDRGRSVSFYADLADDLDKLVADSVVTNTSSSVTNLVTELRAYRDRL